MYLRTYYPIVVLSDIHLGAQRSETEGVTHFLKSISCNRLILNGDIIGGWHLQKNGLGRRKAKCTDFSKVIVKIMENFGTQVIYIRGNHDDFLGNLIPSSSHGVQIVKNYIYKGHGKRYYAIHGDIFDTVTTQVKWLARSRDAGYTFLL